MPRQGGGRLDLASGYALNSAAALALEQQLKRVAGLDPADDLNVTAIRALADADLYRILTLAAIGNFTTAAASSWAQPVQVLVVPSTGLFVVSGVTDASDVTVRVLLIIMCAVHFKKWMQEQVAADGVARKMH